MGISLNDVKSTLKNANSFVGVIDGIKDGVENVFFDPNQRGVSGDINNVADNFASTYTGMGSTIQPAYNGPQPTANDGAATSTAAAQQAAGVADTTAYLNDLEQELRRQLGLVSSTRETGLKQLGDSYQNELQSGSQKYGQQKEDNTRQKIGALGQVDTNARVQANNLRRILGLSGSAGQSAGMVGDSAIRRQASQQRSKQVENFGLNDRNIFNAEDAFKKDLETKKKDREMSFLQGLLSQEQGLYGDIGDIAAQKASVNGGNYASVRAARQPFQNEIAARDNQIQSLTSQYATPFNADAKLADLNQFTVDKAVLNANNAGGPQDYSPYSPFINKRKQELSY